MRIRLSERETPRGPWLPRLDECAALAAPRGTTMAPVGEASEYSLAISQEPGDAATDLEVRVGRVLVASTRAQDQPEFPLVPAGNEEGGRRWVCFGPLLRDWVGVTEIAIEANVGGQRRPLLLIENVRVMAGKLSQEVFEALCAEIAAHSSSLLLDVYGKTYFGLEPELRAGETAPLAVLRRLRAAVERLTAALRDIARRPALRLRARLVREPALLGASVNELTLQEVCFDPTLAIRAGRAIAFREQIREDAVHHFDLPENRVLTGFLAFLRLQIADLRMRAGRDLERRRANRAWRDRRGPDGGPSWWEQEDAPRIRELEQELEALSRLDGEVVSLLRLPFLPPAEPLREAPRVTPLFRSHRAYADAFRAIVTHFQAFRVSLDGGHLLARARSLPVLYEWWCYLDVLRLLGSMLTLAGSDSPDDSPFRRLNEQRDRFVVEFAADQSLDFHDRTGRLVRLRYVPRYRNRFLDRAMGYGLLGPEPEMTPDIALEIYRDARTDEPPELIVVLDAKYSLLPHAQLLDRVRSKYGRIGLFATGSVLSRQVWALAPTAPMGGPYLSPSWANSCTADNLSFWSDAFDASAPVAGVVHARPLLGTPSPLESLLRWTLEREGLVLRG